MDEWTKVQRDRLEMLRVFLQRFLVIGAAFLMAAAARADSLRRDPAGDPHPLIRQSKVDLLPRVELNRYYETGGYETLALHCREDRTRDSRHACEITRRRNGLVVATTPLEFERGRELLGRFFTRLEALKDVPEPESEGRRVGFHKALLGWDIGYRFRQARGQVFQHEKVRQRDVVKWVLSLEGTLAAEFYRSP